MTDPDEPNPKYEAAHSGEVIGNDPPPQEALLPPSQAAGEEDGYLMPLNSLMDGDEFSNKSIPDHVPCQDDD